MPLLRSRTPIIPCLLSKFVILGVDRSNWYSASSLSLSGDYEIYFFPPSSSLIYSWGKKKATSKHHAPLPQQKSKTFITCSALSGWVLTNGKLKVKKKKDLWENSRFSELPKFNNTPSFISPWVQKLGRENCSTIIKAGWKEHGTLHMKSQHFSKLRHALLLLVYYWPKSDDTLQRQETIILPCT